MKISFRILKNTVIALLSFGLMYVGYAMYTSGIFNAPSDVATLDNLHTHNTIQWHWVDDFNADEVLKIKHWLNGVDSGLVHTFGKYPFTLHLFLHRIKSDKSNEPVPWAHTIRFENEGIHFHVDTHYSFDEFYVDWTAPHEMSHLSIPYVGKNNMWFSEGYASFMQYQVMENMGLYSAQECEAKYRDKFEKVRASFESDVSFISVVKLLKQQYNYPSIYWGGARFFYHLDRAYQAKIDMRFSQVMRQYVRFCWEMESTPLKICREWDQITQTHIASDLLLVFQEKPASFAFGSR